MHKMEYYLKIKKINFCFNFSKGHADKAGEYHHYTNPICLYDAVDNSKHSPIIGYAFDGFPIYGPFGYSDPTDSSSSIKRVATSYRLRDIKERRILPDGTKLKLDSSLGPDVDSEYPLGTFIQDYEFVNGLGDLGIYLLIFL